MFGVAGSVKKPERTTETAVCIARSGATVTGMARPRKEAISMGWAMRI